MHVRLSFPIAAAALLVSCGTPATVNRIGYEPSSRPTITGHHDLISDAEIRSALRSARDRLATLAPWSPIFRIIVISPTRLEAYYWTDYDRERIDLFYQNHARSGYLVLERFGAEWRVLPGRTPKVLNDQGYIVTG